MTAEHTVVRRDSVNVSFWLHSRLFALIRGQNPLFKNGRATVAPRAGRYEAFERHATERRDTFVRTVDRLQRTGWQYSDLQFISKIRTEIGCESFHGVTIMGSESLYEGDTFFRMS